MWKIPPVVYVPVFCDKVFGVFFFIVCVKCPEHNQGTSPGAGEGTVCLMVFYLYLSGIFISLFSKIQPIGVPFPSGSLYCSVQVWARVRKGGTKVHFTWVDGTQQVALAAGPPATHPVCLRGGIVRFAFARIIAFPPDYLHYRIDQKFRRDRTGCFGSRPATTSSDFEANPRIVSGVGRVPGECREGGGGLAQRSPDQGRGPLQTTKRGQGAVV